MLQGLQPTKGLFTLAKAMFSDLWAHRLEKQHLRSSAHEAELAKTERKIEQLLDRIVDAETPAVIKAYENRIGDLEGLKIELREKIAEGGRPAKSFDESLRTALEFLGNPQKLWASERIEDKRTVLKLTFADRLAYVRNEGFRTANLALPFKALGEICSGKIKVASPRGIEPLFRA